MIRLVFADGKVRIPNYDYSETITSSAKTRISKGRVVDVYTSPQQGRFQTDLDFDIYDKETKTKLQDLVLNNKTFDLYEDEDYVGNFVIIEAPTFTKDSNFIRKNKWNVKIKMERVL